MLDEAPQPSPGDERERERLRALRDYGVLDTPADPIFDDLTALAALICGTPISLVSLVDEDRQWFKSHHGLPAQQTPRSLSFCSHSIREKTDIMVVEDATKDPRFSGNALVTGNPGIRYYAAAPLRTPEGHGLGTLCVIDVKPRHLTPEQLDALRMLAKQAMSQFELRRALNALRQSEERFECVARAVSDVVWDWDLRTGKVWWSDSMLKVFGHAKGAFSENIEFRNSLLHPEDRHRVLYHISGAIERGEATWNEEYRFRRADGSYAVVQDHAQLMRDSQGTAYRIVGGMSDFTERKQLEAQYLRAQRIESIGALAGGIAHDLNNVLTPILMSVGLLKERLSGDPAALGNIAILHSSAMRAANLVRQVLSFARGTEGVRKATSIQNVLNEALRLVRETFPRDITVHCEFAAEAWMVNGDATHLHQVFMNLLVNARDAMAERGGTLTISVRNAVLDRADCAPYKRAAGDYVIATIEDTGAGIPPEIMDRIFDPFFTTKPHGQGTGLGLSTVHGIVASHGGFTRVASTVGKGTRFEVCLPAISRTQLSSTEAASHRPELGRGELVLLVDDEAAIRSVASLALTLHGYEVVTAENGMDALTVFRANSEKVAAAVIDSMMPVMDGATCATELLRLKPDLPIIGASGVNQTLPYRGAPMVRFFLPKPYTGDALLSAVRAAIDAPAR